MKRSLPILFAMTMWLPAYQQNMDVLQVDKLKRELANATADSSRALLLTQLAEAYRDRISDTTFYYAQKALELSKRINYPRGKAKALLSLSHYFYNRRDLPQALELGLTGLALAKNGNGIPQKVLDKFSAFLHHQTHRPGNRPGVVVEL